MRLPGGPGAGLWWSLPLAGIFCGRRRQKLVNGSPGQDLPRLPRRQFADRRHAEQRKPLDSKGLPPARLPVA